MLGTQVLSGLSHPSDTLGSGPGCLGSRQGRRERGVSPRLSRGSPGQREGEGSFNSGGGGGRGIKGRGRSGGGCVSEMSGN